MFEVVDVKPRRWRRPLIKARCVEIVQARKGARTFEGHGNYSYQQYLLLVPIGATYTIKASRGDLLEIGDRLSFAQMDARGAFVGQWFLVRS